MPEKTALVRLFEGLVRRPIAVLEACLWHDPPPREAIWRRERIALISFGLGWDKSPRSSVQTASLGSATGRLSSGRRNVRSRPLPAGR